MVLNVKLDRTRGKNDCLILLIKNSFNYKIIKLNLSNKFTAFQYLIPLQTSISYQLHGTGKKINTLVPEKTHVKKIKLSIKYYTALRLQIKNIKANKKQFLLH